MVVVSFRGRIGFHPLIFYRKPGLSRSRFFAPPRGGKGCAYPPLQGLALCLAPAPQRAGGFAPRRPAAAAPLPGQQGGAMYQRFPSGNQLAHLSQNA